MRDVVIILFRQKLKILSVATIIFAAVVAWTYLPAPIYRSEAKLFVRLGRESVSLDPTASLNPSQIVSVGQSRDNEINSALEMLRGRGLIERVVDELGADAVIAGNVPAGKKEAPKPASPKNLMAVEKATTQLYEHLAIDAKKSSNVVSVAYETTSPEMAQAVVKILLDLFMDQHLQVNRTPKSKDFFVKESEQARLRLDDLERRLRDLKNKTGVSSVGEQRSILLKRLGTLEEDSLQTQAGVAAAQAGSQFLRQQEGLPANPDTDSQMRLMGKTEAVRVSSLQAKQQALTTQIVAARAEIKALNDQEAEFARLDRERDLAADNFRQYTRSLEQARIDHELQAERITNVNVFQPPTFSPKPVKPKKLLNLAIGSFLAVVGGLGAAFFAEFLDHSVRRPEDLEQKLALASLGSIPRLSARTSLLRRVTSAHG